MKNSIKIQTEIMKHIKRYNEGKVPRNAGYTEFGKVDDLHFAGKGKHKPVYVYEGENLVGLIMPMKMPKNKD